MDNALDKEILNLFVARSENAISKTQENYGAYVKTIVRNILSDDEDVKECVNDTMLKVWDTIPPTKPKSMKAYIGTIARNMALDKYRKGHSKKRLPQSGFADIIDELNDCIPWVNTTEQLFESNMISGIISKYLNTVSADKKYIFVRRYYHAESVKQIAKDLYISQSNVKTTLFRMRKELKLCLEKEGVQV